METRINGSIQHSPIVLYSVSTEGEPVVVISVISIDGNARSEDAHIYYAGGAAAHNKLFHPL